MKTAERPCTVTGCSRTVGMKSARGLCGTHYARWRRHGSTGSPDTSRAPGVGFMNTNGYRMHRREGKPRYEHRLVMEQRIGRLLTQQEIVHHVDENPANNDPSNLWVFPDKASHSRWHAMLKSGDELQAAMPAVEVI